MTDTTDLKAALEVIGVLLIPIVLLLESWLDEALACADMKPTGTATERDAVRTKAKRLWPRMFVLWAFCSALALLVARPWLTLEFAGWTTHQLIPTAFGLMATTLWCGAMGLAVLTGRIVYNRIKSDR